MHDAADIMMILDVATSARLIDFCLQGYYGRYQDLIELNFGVTKIAMLQVLLFIFWRPVQII